jgi:hypothetical protein
MIHAGCSLDCCHHRVFRSVGGVRAFLRSHEVGGYHGRAVSHHAHHQRDSHCVLVLRTIAAGEILTEALLLKEF